MKKVVENQAESLVEKLLPSDGVLPSDKAAEAALIGIFLNYPETIERVIGKLRASDFHDENHQNIFSCIIDLFVCGKAVNVISLADELDTRGKLDQVGGRYCLTAFPLDGFSIKHLESCVSIVLEKSKKRRRWDISSKIAKSSLNGVDDAEFSIYLSQLVDTQRDGFDDDRFKIHWADEALEDQGKIEWVINRVFVKPGVSMLHGPHGSKKTYTMLDAMVNISCGNPWLGFETMQCATLFIDEESGEKRLKRRLAEVLRGNVVDREIPLAFCCLSQFDLRKADDAAVLSRIIKKVDAKFVVIDAMADVMPGAEENSSKDIIPLFLNIRRVANETDSHIVLLHHDNKLGDYRGSSAIPAAIDAMFQVKSEKRSGMIEFIGKKTRDVDEFDFFAEIVFDAGKVYLRTSDAPARNDGVVLQAMMDVLKKDGELNETKLHKRIGGNKSAFLDVARKAVADGVVVLRKGKRNANIYSLP